jgi:DNA-binding response OmpR family regulator
MDKQILIVDDDPLLSRSLTYSLQNAGYKTEVAGSAEDALTLTEVYRPDVVLLDITLPGMDGLDALHALHVYTNAPVIFVTARRRELDEIIGLEVGADDYITKPFNTDVLLARIKAVLRRKTFHSREAELTHVTVGDISIDPRSHSVQLENEPIELSPKEYQLLLILAQQVERVFSVDELLDHVWGEAWIGESQTVYVHVRWLREKIERHPDHPKHLLTVRGAGYKLVP